MKLLALLLISLISFTACSNDAAKKAKTAAAAAPVEAPRIKVAPVESRTIPKTISITGSLLPDETVNLSFEVPGTLSRTFTDFGRMVKKGEVLGELDRREITLQLERSRAALAQSLARIGLTPEQVDSHPDTTPQIRQAQAQADDARSKFESAQRLVKTGDIARERFTELEKAYNAREAALQAARDDLRTQLAAIQGLRADVRLAEKRLGDTTLRAPFDGAVTQRLVSPGQYIKENTPVLTIVKAYPLRLRADIPESGVSEVRLGTTLTFTTDAAPNAHFRAVVRELNPTLDAKSRSLTAEARLVDNDGRLRPGMFVQVELVLSRAAQVVAVPKSALYSVAGLTKVFGVRDGVVTEYKVQPGQELEGLVVIPDVLKPGEQVATSGLDGLVNGLKVQVGG
jgi:RND family efflux transporter MFP subunit